MKLLMENWRGYLNEMISQEEIALFDTVMKDPNKKKALADLLQQLGWPQEMIQYHGRAKTTPFAELRNVILNIEHYQVPENANPIDPANLYIEPGNIADREEKYQDYIAGKVDKYFRDDPSDPREINFQELPPITAQETDNGLEVTDGIHRAFLAKKANEKLNVWTVKEGNTTGPVVEKIKELFNI